VVKKDDEKKFDHQLGKRLHNLRTARGMSQMELAEALGVAFQQVQKYETGVNMASPWKLCRLAEIFGVPVASFFEAESKAGTGAEKHTTRLMTLMGRLRRIDSQDTKSFTAIYDLAKALDPEED
jgi:transcriptional regulator with XRE-family HTH domain